MFKRDLYLNELIEKQNNHLIKVITGIRRCGKSYLLNTIFYNHLISKENVSKERIIKFAFDDEEDIKPLSDHCLVILSEK
ncbi:MAG: AAA family ATPase [Bacilli bacterium]|nr:AAA family ATPase [Bacilli bacterium]